MNGEQSAARKLRATRRVSDLAEHMSRDDGLALWKEKGHAALFLAAYAAAAKKGPVQLDTRRNPGHKLFDVVNYYSLQKSISDIGELAALHLAAGGTGSIDQSLTEAMPGLMEAGATELEDALRGPDPLGALISVLKGLDPAQL